MSDTTKVFVFVGTGASLFFSALILVGFAFSLHDPEPGSLLGLPLGTFSMAASAYGMDRLLSWATRNEARLAPAENVALTPPDPKKESTSKYCKDCGKIFTMRQQQRGFDPNTGSPKLSFDLGCPDADPTRPTAAYRTWAASPYPMSITSMPREYDWPDCGKTKYVPLTPVGHNHADDGVQTNCPKCIEDMLTTGIIDLPSAKKLMSSIR